MQQAEQETEQRPEQRRVVGRPFAAGTSGNPHGKALIVERARQAELERQAEAAALTADLGRPPTAAERLLVDEAAALAVEARKLRRLGRSSSECSRLLSRILGQLGLNAKSRPSRAEESFAEALARHKARRDAEAPPEAEEEDETERAEPAPEPEAIP